MLELNRTTSDNEEFKKLTNLLDIELNKKNGEEQKKYDEYNVINDIKTVLIAKDNDKAVGCGCFKDIDGKNAEIKRLYVKPEARKNGVAMEILKGLELWAQEKGYTKCILETGVKNEEARSLYEKSGYIKTDNFGQYKNMPMSICYEKVLI